MKLKQILASSLVLAMVSGTMTFTASANEADVWDGESYSLDWLETGNPENTAGDEYYLNSAADLAGLAHYVNTYASTNNIFTGDTIYLNVDVDLDNQLWAPIGTAQPREKNRFYGSFDGQGHTISNLNVEEGHYFAGLFGQIPTYSYTQEFRNITINNANVVAADETESGKSKEAAGALIGRANGSVVDNCHVTGEVYISGDRFVGGLLGHSYAQISGSSVTATGTINADTWQAGGLVGSHGATASYTSKVENCSVIGAGDEGLNITSYYASAGGAIGSVSVSGVDSTIMDNITVANVAIAAESEDYGSNISYVSAGYQATNSTIGNVSATLGNEEYIANDSETVTASLAEVGGEYFTALEDAIKAMTAENNTLNILEDITIDYKWDCRPVSKGGTGATFTFPVVINGNGHTLKFTDEISDGFNHLAVFRPEAEATFMNLTVDMSEAISVFQNRFSVISSKDANLTVTDCNFIGSETATNARTIIFGESADNNDAEVVVSGCTFTNFRYGVVDNMNGKDVSSVTITDSEFDNASIQISASDEVTITGNNVDGGFVKVSSYTQSPEQNLTVTVKDNVLDEDFATDNQIQAGAIIDAQPGFITPVAEVNGKKYMTLKSAVSSANDGDVVYVAPGTYADDLVINKSITITGAPKATTFAARAAIEKPVIKINDVTNGGVEYHAPNVTFDNIVFEVADNATGNGWNVSALGYYYEIVANREGLTVTNCDFINNSDISLGAIAANIGKYTVTNNTFTNFATGVWSYVDHGAADEIVVSDNTFTNVVNLVNIYHGVAADGSANVTITNNKATDENTTQISVTDFGQTKATPATAYNNVTITGNDADVVLGNYAEASFALTNENNNSIVYNYATEAILRALETAGVPDGDVYVNYGSDAEVMYKVVDGNVYSAANTIEVEFEPASEAEGEKIYNINLKANAQGIINRLNSADLTFLFSQVEGANEYEIIASNSEVAINPVDNSKVRYEFHYNGKDNVLTDTDTVITIGQVKFTGYGKFSFAVDATATTNAAHATTMMDNIVDTFIPGGDITAGEGNLDISDDTIKDVIIAVPDRNLAITIDFPNAINDQVKAYQDMKVVISGGDLAEDITIDLGKDAAETELDIFGKADAKFNSTMDNGSYKINVTDALTLNNAYTVTVSGAGYRTARYTVTMTDDKALRFWNNVMDENQIIETGKDSSTAKVTFLAGDIVKDNNINIYDLSAVVSYFGTETKTEAFDTYAKYDLNRDGVIDSKDVAYVLVSWNN